MTDQSEYIELAYIICRYTRWYPPPTNRIDELHFEGIVHATFDCKSSRVAAFKSVKQLSETQPGIYILFQGGEVCWHDSTSACYWPIVACQDGKTLYFTENIDDHSPDRIYTHGDFWEFKIEEVRNSEMGGF